MERCKARENSTPEKILDSAQNMNVGFLPNVVLMFSLQAPDRVSVPQITCTDLNFSWNVFGITERIIAL